MNLREVRIGILGGLGHSASSFFYSSLIERIQKNYILRYNGDYPKIIINSVPINEPTTKGMSDSDIQLMLQGLKELDSFNPNFIVIVCNTAYKYYAHFSENVNSYIINLPVLIELEITKRGISKVGLLSTVITKELIAEYVEVVSPCDQCKLNQLINGVNTGQNISLLEKIFRKCVHKFSKTNVRHILLGCTELELIAPKSEKYNFIKPMELLLNDVIKEINLLVHYKYAVEDNCK